MTYIPVELRRQVIERAGGYGEYYQIQMKIGCNSFKGSDITPNPHFFTTCVPNILFNTYETSNTCFPQTTRLLDISTLLTPAKADYARVPNL